MAQQALAQTHLQPNDILFGTDEEFVQSRDLLDEHRRSNT
jgi:hypothetical protein